MPEIPFEGLYMGLEPTRGGALTDPTNRLNMTGTIMPHQEVFRPEDQLGSLALVGRSEIVRRWSTIEAEGALDNWTLPILANMVMGPVTTPTTPGVAVLSRLWTFLRVIGADTIKSAKFWWGDPAFQMFLASYAMADELGIEADASGTDGSTMTCNFTGQFLDDVAAPTLPGVSLSPLFVPKKMQVWMDTSSAIGTTELVARVIKASHTIPTGVTYKYPATGPAGGVTYSRTGRVATNPETTITLELLDMAQWALFENGDRVKLRVRHNGPKIETVSATDFYNYVEVDMYGILDSPEWDSFEDSNRTINLTVVGEYEAGIGSDCRLAVQSTRTTL